MYYILKNNIISFIDILLGAKNIYEIISLYDDQICNFYAEIQDIRILSLLFHKRNFGEKKSPIQETITPAGVFSFNYPRMTIFNNYFTHYIINASNENLEKIFCTKNNIFKILEDCIPTQNICITCECLWRTLYYANEKRISAGKDNQKNKLTKYCKKNISYIDNTSIQLLVQEKTPLASYLLHKIGKAENLPHVNEEEVIESYTKQPIKERIKGHRSDLNLKYLLENTGWQNIATPSNEN